MSSTTSEATPVPATLPGLAAIRTELRTLIQLARSPDDATLSDLRGQQKLLAWLEGRERRLAALEQELSRTPDDAALASEWLSAAPSPPAHDDGTLAERVAVLERHLFELAGSLLQHSDSRWARDLYRDLLDHARGTSP